MGKGKRTAEDAAKSKLAHRQRLEVIKSYLGGITPVWHSFQDEGYIGLSRKAVEKWYERNWLPEDKWKVFTMALVRDEKIKDFFSHVAKMGITPEDLFK